MISFFDFEIGFDGELLFSDAVWGADVEDAFGRLVLFHGKSAFPPWADISYEEVGQFETPPVLIFWMGPAIA